LVKLTPTDLKTVVQNRLQMFALNAEVVFSEVDNQKKSIEEGQVTLATSEKFISLDIRTCITTTLISVKSFFKEISKSDHQISSNRFIYSLYCFRDLRGPKFSKFVFVVLRSTKWIKV
jgi:hypothetical protein